MPEPTMSCRRSDDFTGGTYPECMDKAKNLGWDVKKEFCPECLDTEFCRHAYHRGDAPKKILCDFDNKPCMQREKGIRYGVCLSEAKVSRLFSFEEY